MWNSFKLKEGTFKLDTRKKCFTLTVVRHWNRLGSEVLDAPFLAALKVRLDGDLGWWKVSLPTVGCSKRIFKVPSNPGYSMILQQWDCHHLTRHIRSFLQKMAAFWIISHHWYASDFLYYIQYSQYARGLMQSVTAKWVSALTKTVHALGQQLTHSIRNLTLTARNILQNGIDV